MLLIKLELRPITNVTKKVMKFDDFYSNINIMMAKSSLVDTKCGEQGNLTPQ